MHSHTKPRTNLCTEATAYVMNKLADIFHKPKALKKENPNEVAFYKSLSRRECFYSKEAQESDTFSREIFKMTELAKKTSKQVCRSDLGSSENILGFHPDFVEDVFKKNVDKLATQESVNMFRHHFNKKIKPVIMGIPSDSILYPDVRAGFTEFLLAKKALKKIFPVIKQIATELLYKNLSKSSIDINEFASAFALKTILHGVIKAPFVDNETVSLLNKQIEQGVDEAVQLGSLARISLEAYTPWKMRSYADERLENTEKIILKEVLKRNEKAIRSNPESWLVKTVEDEKNIQKTCCSKASDILSSDSVRETAFLITAGSDTTAHNIAMTFLSILQNEKLKDEFTKEIFSVGKTPEQMEIEDYSNLPLAKKIVLESLRYHPPLPIQKILVKKGFTTYNGVEIKAGTHVYINVRETNRTPTGKEEFFKDFDTFNPYRWKEFDARTISKFLEPYPENFKYRFNFQTFGRNKRMCPGRELAILETTVALFKMFYYFDMTLLNKVVSTYITFGMRPIAYDDKHNETPIKVQIKLHK